MASGNKREKINTGERAISDDVNRLQAFIAQERNDIIQALLQRSYSEFEQPGVSVPSSGAVATPLAATVIDGLEIDPTNPGGILITAGVLAAWNGAPGSADDTGVEVIVDPGVQSNGVLVIATNGGGFPRCDVIECSIVHDAVVEGGFSRDIRNPTTGVFAPASVDKVLKSQLTYRVRQGTPGSGPGYAAGWLPLGLAVIQPGASTAQVDFYDVRPLYREMGNCTPQNDSTFTHPIVPDTRDYVVCSGTSPVTSSELSGHAIATIDGMRFGGPLYRNSPLAVASLGNFGSASAGGGDRLSIQLSAENTLRGASFGVTANDIVVVAAFLPDLGGSIPLPRCVRYCEHIEVVPATPSRRRAFGANGILLATALSQDPQLGPNGSIGSTVLNATGIAGCLGSGVGVPLTMARVNPDGVTLSSPRTGFADGIALNDQYRVVVANRVILSLRMFHSGGIDSTVITSATPVAIANANFTIPVVVGDRLEMRFGCLGTFGNTSGSAQLILQLTEDIGISGTPAVSQAIFLAPSADVQFLSHNWTYPVTKTGNLQVLLFVQSDASHTVRVYSPLDDWGSFSLIRPL